MASGSKFFGAGLAQGLGQSIGQLPALLLTIQQMEQQAQDQEVLRENQKLKNDLLKLKTREFDLQQKQLKNAEITTLRLRDAIAGGGAMEILTQGQGGQESTPAEAFDFEMGGGAPSGMQPPAFQGTGPNPLAGFLDRFDVEFGFDPAMGGIVPKSFKPRQQSLKAASGFGKLLQDRQMYVDEFGEGSPQVRSLDKVISGEQAKLSREATGARGPAKLSDIGALRDDFVRDSKDFVLIRNSLGRIRAAAKSPSPAGDLSIMFNYMKMLDPGSVVRESEFATIAATGALGTRMQALVQQVQTGKRLTNEQRNDFLTKAEELFGAQLGFQKQNEEQYRGIAQRSGVNPKDVVVDYVGKYRNQPTQVENLPPANTVPPGTEATNPDTGMTVVSDGEKWVPVGGRR